MLILLASLTVPAALALGGDEGELMSVMSGLAKGLRPRVAFVEERQSVLLNRPLIIRGELMFEPPNTLRRSSFEPSEETLHVEGSTLTLERANGETVSLDLNREPVAQALVEAFRGTLSGDLERLRRHYRVLFSGSEMEWRIELTPRLESVSKAIESIKIEGREADVGTIVVLRADGEQSVMHLQPIGGTAQ